MKPRFQWVWCVALALALEASVQMKVAAQTVGPANDREELYGLGAVGCIVVQPDGKILVRDAHGLYLRSVNPRTGNFGKMSGGIFRFYSDGTVDRSFLSEVESQFESDVYHRWMVLQPDGKVLTHGNDQPVLRLLPNGRLDRSFALEPTATNAPGVWSMNEVLRPFGLGPGGEILVRSTSTNHYPPVTQLNYDGPSTPALHRFDASGRFLDWTAPEISKALAVTLHREGFILANGRTLTQPMTGEKFDLFEPLKTPLDKQLAEPRLGETLRSFFGAVPLSLCRYALRLPDGRAVIAFAEPRSPRRGRFLRFGADWQLDRTFSARFELGRIPSCIEMAADGRGGVLVAGGLATLNGQKFTGIARVLPDGSTDPNFRARIEDKDLPVPAAMAVQRDGRVLVGGYFTAINGIRCTHFARLNPDGSLDEQFTRRFTFDEYSKAIHRLMAPRIQLASAPLHGGAVAASTNALTGVNSPASPLASGTSAAVAETIWIRQLEIVQGAAIIEFQGAPERAYQLHARDSLDREGWFVVATVRTDASGVAVFKDTRIAEAPMRLYRIGAVR